MEKTAYYVWLSEMQLGNQLKDGEALKIVKDAREQDIQIIHIESELYPDRLRQIHKPPFVLYCLGDVLLLNKAEVAVVGTRRPSPYGKWVTSKIGEALANHNAVHVSGMAEGIDGVGHRAVLNAGGKSIAVLGTGIDVVYPKSSLDIYERLKNEGLIVSEYKPGTKGSKTTFPARNRIISGLSAKCIIVEGALRSGSLITSRFALEQGKDVYAVPGNINEPNAIVPNNLIADGATPITSVEDIEDILFMGS